MHVCIFVRYVWMYTHTHTDGHTYEREAIEKWFRRSSSSPLTNEKLASKVCVCERARERVCIHLYQSIPEHIDDLFQN